jgi:cation transport regulator ChaC
MSELVFAFGFNICSGRFRDYKVSPQGPGRPAVLPGHRLRFNKKSTDDLSGKANVTTQEGSEVWGVLYSIPYSDLQKLDKGEGGYQRVRLPTKPGVQARHWYGQVLFDAILRQSQYPSAKVIIALPDFPVFMNLIGRTKHALEKLDIGVFVVRDTCMVDRLF